jgi:sarcosine oxidase delta subunit
MRRNRTGINEERWYHSRGCGRFLRVKRDLATNAVLGVAPA